MDEPPKGNLWVPALQELWLQLSENRILDDEVAMHRGLEWNIDQSLAVSDRPQRGFTARNSILVVTEFSTHSSRRNGLTAVRKTVVEGRLRCPGRIQKLFSMLRGLVAISGVSLPVLTTKAWFVRNSSFVCGLVPPVTLSNAGIMRPSDDLLQMHSPQCSRHPGARFRIGTLGRIPLPSAFRPTVAPLVEAYLKKLNAPARSNGDCKICW